MRAQSFLKTAAVKQSARPKPWEETKGTLTGYAAPLALFVASASHHSSVAAQTLGSSTVCPSTCLYCPARVWERGLDPSVAERRKQVVVSQMGAGTALEEQRKGGGVAQCESDHCRHHCICRWRRQQGLAVAETRPRALSQATLCRLLLFSPAVLIATVQERRSPSVSRRIPSASPAILWKSRNEGAVVLQRS